ncbi:unnamed protein product [Lampetra planeri]
MKRKVEEAPTLSEKKVKEEMVKEVDKKEVDEEVDKEAGRFVRAPKDPPPAPSKPMKQDLYRPPTSEELNHLRETQQLFHSGLLRMQLDELLAEVRLPQKKREMIDAFLHDLNGLLDGVPPTPPQSLSEEVCVPDLDSGDSVQVPFRPGPGPLKGRFCSGPPAAVRVVGSYLLGTTVRPDVAVDVAVTMPMGSLQPKDHLNQRYLHKRALYLAHLAAHLADKPGVGDLRYTLARAAHTTPVLVVRPPGKAGRQFSVRLHVVPPDNFFLPSRFHPAKNNVRPEWFAGKTPREGGSDGAAAAAPPTPHYNASVLSDLLMEPHLHFLFGVAAESPALRDAAALLRVWLRQRSLHAGQGGFGGFLASMLLALLLSTRRLSRALSSYQLVRGALHFLADTDLTKEGASFVQEPQDGTPSLADFHAAYDVVFVDPTGHLNLCADMTAATFHRVQREARASLAVLDAGAPDAFELLFMRRVPFARAHDHLLHVRASRLQAVCRKLALLPALRDRGGDYVAAALPSLARFLQRGLGARALAVAHAPRASPEWEITAEPPLHRDLGPVTFGLLLNSDLYTGVLERGPAADSAQAAEFRAFWGERSELRRFQDGSICEAVLWSCDSVAERRLIPEQIIKHLLHTHTDVPPECVSYVGGQVEALIQVPRTRPSQRRTGEEELTAVVQACDELGRWLRGLQGLPLTVTSVQGTHPALRHTAVMPPIPTTVDPGYSRPWEHGPVLTPDPEKPAPAYVPALTVICHMEGSGRWPKEREGIRRIKAAFHIRLAELLSREHHVICQPCQSHVDVYKDGFVFRVRVAYRREPAILKEQRAPDGAVKLRDTEESLALERDTVHRPLHASHIAGLQQQYPAFSAACRLTARWVAAQLLSDYVREEAVELLVARVFLQPAPYSTPSCPQVAFLRVLELISSFDWANSALVVNFNNTMTEADVTEVGTRLAAMRAQHPVMFIATPDDHHSSMWTRGTPTAQILQRLMALAAETCNVLERAMMEPEPSSDIRKVFRPSLEVFDVLLRLAPRHLPRAAHAVDRPAVTLQRGVLPAKPAKAAKAAPVSRQAQHGHMPAVEYDPARLFLQELQDAFGELALFFHDPYGGDIIGVVWRPDVFAPQPFATSHVAARRPHGQNGVAGGKRKAAPAAALVPNVPAVLGDMAVLGQGLLLEVEPRTERWGHIE